MSELKECPYCEERTLRVELVEPDTFGGVCEACGFNGYCDQCDEQIPDPHLQGDPNHCSDECAYRSAVEREAETQITMAKERR